MRERSSLTEIYSFYLRPKFRLFSEYINGLMEIEFGQLINQGTEIASVKKAIKNSRSKEG